MQGPFQVMPKALRREAVDGRAKSHTVSVTGTCAAAPPVTFSVPW